MVFAAGVVWGVVEGSAAEFGGPDDEGIVEEPAGFEVAEEACDGLVDVASEGDVFLHIAVRVPVA